MYRQNFAMGENMCALFRYNNNKKNSYNNNKNSKLFLFLQKHGEMLLQSIPVIRGRCWENAARRSFFSRDNMENFIQFCRRLGVHENLLFESDDLGKARHD